MGLGGGAHKTAYTKKCWGPLACRRYMCHIGDDRSIDETGVPAMPVIMMDYGMI